MSGEVPDDWSLGHVLDFFQLQRGHDLPVQDRQPGTVPVIASNGQVGWHNQSPLAGPGVVTGRSGTIGNVSFMQGAYWPLNTTLYVRDFKGSDPEFTYYFLQHFPMKDYATGTGVPTLNRNDVHAVDVVFPPLDEQRRIAEVLRSVDEAIAATQTTYDAAVAAQAAAFATFLQSGNLIADSLAVNGWTTGKIDGVHRLPAGWQIVRLVDIARLESGHTPDRKKPEYWDGGDVEWISLHDTQNLERSDIEQTEMRITQAGLANSSARLLPPGTVCFSRTATVGKCVIMAKSMATSQDFANFICSPKLNNRYLLHLMRWMQPVWKALASGSTHKTIYMPTFKALQIVLPTRAEQDQIAATMDGFMAVAEWHAASLERLRLIKAAITSDLLSGRVRVPE
ncbi:hypothetical protein BSL82_09175 [Tardibacter chloracetimidivorans]|uniref:Type I restriction modification DNA specificity domain-containing protein n=1 Tax=Tardibacter chloracetimidivorans TaxID=1921510 RepID=A0A1L3ZV37_9SPHN|nr:restriction endonuclease subunit S [Tardibacter chloracetimidivorans]API59460.1 hypothetical protein BSL82_09175 [Tardibacter chloracetimidivorans]